MRTHEDAALGRAGPTWLELMLPTCANDCSDMPRAMHETDVTSPLYHECDGVSLLALQSLNVSL